MKISFFYSMDYQKNTTAYLYVLNNMSLKIYIAKIGVD